MKDIQGIQRGKCNSCECEEYRTAPQAQSGSLRCEYCNHTPGEHVRIIELGECTKCGKNECDKYVSEDPHRYTDCEYCGCDASLHAGADKLRRPQPGMPPQGRSIPPRGGGVMSQPRFQPRQDAYGKPLQDASLGTCKCPGCSYPRRREGDKVHDFCSRTCATKYSSMQSSFHQQKVATAAQTVQQGGSPKVPTTTKSPGILNSLFGSSTSQPAAGPSGGVQALQGPGGRAQTSGTAPNSGGKRCSKCGVNPANPGRGWCQPCYAQSNP